MKGFMFSMKRLAPSNTFGEVCCISHGRGVSPIFNGGCSPNTQDNNNKE